MRDGAPSVTRTIRLRHCSIEYTDAGCTMRFDDGAAIDAIPHPSLPHYHVIAHRLGYGDDLMAYCREHEVCHALIAEWFHDEPSQVLWALAHGEPHDYASGVLEEIATQALQRFIRANERPIVGDVDWDALRERALKLMEA